MTHEFIREYLIAAYLAARTEAFTTDDWTKTMHIETCLHFMEGDSAWHRQQNRLIDA